MTYDHDTISIHQMFSRQRSWRHMPTKGSGKPERVYVCMSLWIQFYNSCPIGLAFPPESSLILVAGIPQTTLSVLPPSLWVS